MPKKPLTLAQARPLLKALYPDDRVVTFETKLSHPFCTVFMNEEPEARWFGDAWEPILEQALISKYLT